MGTQTYKACSTVIQVKKEKSNKRHMLRIEYTDISTIEHLAIRFSPKELMHVMYVQKIVTKCAEILLRNACAVT